MSRIMYVVEHDNGGYYLARNKADERLTYYEFMDLLRNMKKAVPNRLDYVSSQPVYVFTDRVRMLDQIQRAGLTPDWVNKNTLN